MHEEHELLVHPVVPESVVHNAKVCLAAHLFACL